MQKKTLTKAKTDARAAAVTAAISETAPAATTTIVALTTTVPSHEQIAQRAYEIYVARGQTPGNELDDWIQAERELLTKAHRNN